MSADEIHLENLHTITSLVSGILAITLCVAIGIQLYEKSTVHAAIFLVMAAAASDSFSSMFELIHLSLYAHNGIGSYAMVSFTKTKYQYCTVLYCTVICYGDKRGVCMLSFVCHVTFCHVTSRHVTSCHVMSYLQIMVLYEVLGSLHYFAQAKLILV